MLPTSIRALRTHAIRRSLFAPTDLLGAIEALGFVQLDPIRAPARAADLILRHRVAGYRTGDLDRTYPELPVTEDYVHVYGVMPVTVQRMLHPRGEHKVWRIEREHPKLSARIVAHVRVHGATHPRDLAHVLGKTRVVNDWGGQSAATTRMLDAMQYRGMLRVVRREGGVRVYDLAPAFPRPRAAAARADAILALLLRLYAPLPDVCFRQLARSVTKSSLPPEVREPALDRMLKGRKLRRIDADGARFVMPGDEPLRTETEDRVRLLAPFDPVVWDRRRFAHLWGWEYRFEAYTPPSRRKLGYYALPMLWRDDVIGWANAASKNGVLRVATGFMKARPRGAPFRRALETEAAALAKALGATDWLLEEI
jgi:uncharacterized protein